MEIVKFKSSNSLKFGKIEKDKIVEIKNFSFNSINFEFGDTFDKSKHDLVCPLSPSKIIGIALNNKKLVGKEENFEEPLIFLKSPTSITSKNNIEIPDFGCKIWVEAEIGIVISKKGKNIKKDRAKDYIFGHIIANDLTMDNLYGRDHHLGRSKSLDKFCPISKYIHTGVETKNLFIKTQINGKKYQDGNSSDRILNDYECIELVSKFITLEEGDLILTGTVENALNCVVKNNDEVKMEIENLGELSHKIILE